MNEENLLGEWRIDSIKGRSVVDNSPAILSFLPGQRLAGIASCNAMSGRYTLEGASLAIGQTALTRKMCPPALMDQEQRLLEALRQVASAEFENDLLILRDVAGEQLVRGGRIN